MLLFRLTLAVFALPLSTLLATALPAASSSTTNKVNYPPAIGLDLLTGPATAPCTSLVTQMSFDPAFVFNRTLDYCFDANKQNVTCIRRRTVPAPVDAQEYAMNGETGGLDARMYSCVVSGFEVGDCAGGGKGTVAGVGDGAKEGFWSWGDGKKMQSFKMACWRDEAAGAEITLLEDSTS